MIIYRTARREDCPELLRLWHEAFNDLNEGTDFLKHWFSPVSSFVAEESGEIAAMAHLVYGGKYKRVGCPYLYAVAVRGDKRGIGLGKGITRFAVHEAQVLGYDTVATCPASMTLVEFYKRLGFRREATFRKEFKPSRAMLREIEFMKYMLIR